MAVRLIKRGQTTNVAESHYVIDEGDIKPVNELDGDGNIITKIITGSDLIENLDAGGMKKYIFSEKSNSWNFISDSNKTEGVSEIQTGQIAKVFRVSTTASTMQTLTFNVVGTKYLIKNFTTSPIYASMSSSVTTSTGVMIPSESSEILCIDESLTYGSATVSILPVVTATVGVEVRCLSY